MAQGREGHIYILDSKTGEQFAPETIDDEQMELVHGLLGDLGEAERLLDLVEEEYGTERAQSLNVYKDGKKQVDGTEYFTEQAGFDQYLESS